MMTDPIDREELRMLIEAAREPAVSIYLPTHRAGRDVQQNQIRFKNLLKQAEKRLADCGARGSQADDILGPARRLLKDHPFWEHQADGLAVFTDEKSMRRYRLPRAFDELVVVSDTFHVTPLFTVVNRNGSFHVLAVSQDQVRLLRGHQYGIHRVELEGVPTSLTEALRYDDPERQQQYHTGTAEHGPGRRPAVYHGQGVPVDSAGTRLDRFLRQVEEGVTARVDEEGDPLILACVEPIASSYRRLNTYKGLRSEHIQGNADHLSDEKLWSLAWDIVEPIRAEREEQALERYRQQAHHSLATDDIRTIGRKARQGLVEDLFVALGDHQWGVVDAEGDRVELHEDPRPGDRDLLDVAATATFLHGGAVYPMAAGRMPSGKSATALLRA
jgi:hypothetical protein